MKTLRCYLKKASRYCFWVAVIVLALNAGRLVYVRLFASSVYASPALPHTVVLKESVFDSAGTLRATKLYTEAVRSDGSRALGHAGPKGAETHVFRVIEFANGDVAQIDEIREMKTTFPRLRASRPPLRNPRSSCALPQLPGHKSLEQVVGEETVGGRRTIQIRYGSQKTIWYDLDHGCAKVKTRLQHEAGVTEKSLLALIAGEPDGALFRVPASFAEVPPSEFNSRAQSHPALPSQGAVQKTPAGEAAGLEHLDKLYHSRRAHANR